jgi:hypothetical protein
VNDEDVCAGTFIASGSCSDCTGACCFGDGSCDLFAEAECDEGDAAFAGVGVACGDAECSALGLFGACCFAEDSCNVVDEASCENGGGSYAGDGVRCADTDCGETFVPLGACCNVESGCTDGLSEAECIATDDSTYLGKRDVTVCTR